MSVSSPDDLDWRWLARPLDSAGEALTRLDERLRGHTLASGWTARMDFHEACASISVEGGLVHLEDVILADAMMHRRAPDPELSRAVEVLRARRLIRRHGAAWTFSEEGVRGLRNRIDGLQETSVRGEGPAGYWQVETDDGEGLASWKRLLRETAPLPAVVAAAIAYDAWLAAPPFQRDAWLGRQFLAAELQRRAKARHHLPTLSVGLRQASVHELSFRRLTPAARVTEFLKAVEAGALFGVKELERLTLARELMERRLARRRASSHLPELIALFLGAPLVTASLAAKTLGISTQAARGLIGELAGAVREMTDRRRYRAWSIF
jgi:hypothetical protein